MKSTIIVSIIGVLGFNENRRIIAKALFPKDVSKTVEKLLEIESGKATPEVASVVNDLKAKGYSLFAVENQELAQALKGDLGVEVDVETPSSIGESFRERMEELAVEVGFAKDHSEVREWVHRVSMEMSMVKVQKATEKRDLLVVQAVQFLDELDETLNLFMSRLREWYGLHFPEFSRLVDDHETYARLVRNLGIREKFTVDSLEKEGITTSKAQKIAKAANMSMGTRLLDRDIEQIKAICGQVLQLYETRSGLERYLEEMMEEVAPNTSALTGATLGARLIAVAGGLNSLAKMPASTIQVLGAEKALFRSLTTGTRPPKHGIIFQHALVHGSSRWLRGKIARTFAGKIAIAARTDAFSGKYVGDRLKEDLNKRIEEIRKKYAEPKLRPSTPEKRIEKIKDKQIPKSKSKGKKSHGRKG